MLLSSKGFYFASFLFRGNRCSKMSSANPGDVWGMGQRMRFCAPNWPLSHMWVEPHEVVLYRPLVSSAPTASMPTTPDTGLALAASSHKEAWGNVWEMPEFHLMRLRVTRQLSVGMQFSLLTFWSCCFYQTEFLISNRTWVHWSRKRKFIGRILGRSQNL